MSEIVFWDSHKTQYPTIFKQKFYSLSSSSSINTETRKGGNKFSLKTCPVVKHAFQKVTEQWGSKALSLYRFTHLVNRQTAELLQTEVLLLILLGPIHLSQKSLNGFPATSVSTGSQIISASCKRAFLLIWKRFKESKKILSAENETYVLTHTHSLLVSLSLFAELGNHSSSQQRASQQNRIFYWACSVLIGVGIILQNKIKTLCLPWGLSQLSSSLLSWQLFWLSHTKLLSMQRPFLQWNRAVEQSKGFAAAKRESKTFH